MLINMTFSRNVLMVIEVFEVAKLSIGPPDDVFSLICEGGTDKISGRARTIRPPNPNLQNL